MLEENYDYYNIMILIISINTKVAKANKQWS